MGKDCIGSIGSQELQEIFSCFDVFGDVQHSGRVDDLTAHLSGSGVHHGQSGGECVGLVNDAAIYSGFGNLGGNFLDVGAVGDGTGGSQIFLQQIIVRQDLPGILTNAFCFASETFYLDGPGSIELKWLSKIYRNSLK